MNRSRFLMILSLIVLTALVGSAVSSKAFTTQTAQANQDEGDCFISGVVPKQVIIKTRQGQVLSVLDVPIGVMLSIHARIKEKDAQRVPVVFEGNVSIRTKLQTEMKVGPAYEQMMQSPFRLDVQDALVELKIMK